MSMDGMDMGGTTSTGSDSSMSSMSSMPVIFQWNLQTPLYSSSFTPQSSGAYFGTLVFIILLGGLYRGLHAIKHRKEKVWRLQEAERRIVVGGKVINSAASASGKEGIVAVDEKDDGAASEKEDLKKERRRELHVAIAPWRWKVDAVRAVLQFGIAGVGYLLMLAVMTLNVGYFFAVLIGIFIGELAFGRFTV